MVCAKCGAELQEGSIYCSRCGQEVQIVSELNVLEEDYLRSLMDEKKDSEKDGYMHQKEDGAISGYREKKGFSHKKKKRRRNRIVLVVVLVAAAAFVFGFIRYRQTHSAEYLLNRAQTEYTQKDYKGAAEYLDQVLALDEENIDAILLYARIYADEKDYDSAEDMYLSVIELDPVNLEAYEELIKLYDKQEKRDEILDLMDGVTDEDILSLFEDYIVSVPEISEESGSYSEYLTVEITAENDELSIYYTLDGSTPAEDDELYEEPIEINEQGTITLIAICMDEDGYYSEPVCAVYKISLDAPDTPTVYPDGGTFTEPASVTVSVPSGTNVYYTWDNTTPTASSSLYTGPIEIPEGNHILSLVAIDKNGMKSSVLKCNYIYYPSADAADGTDTNDTDTDTAGTDDANTEEGDTATGSIAESAQ